MNIYTPYGDTLVKNGSFQDGVPGYSAPNWTGTTAVPGGTASTPPAVEVNPVGNYGVTGATGTQVLEIDSFSGPTTDVISQQLTTVAGQSYTFTFDFAMRAAATEVGTIAPASNNFNVLVNGKVIGMVTPTSTAFTSASFAFEATGATTTIAFAEIPGPNGIYNDSYGGIVDNVVVKNALVNGFAAPNLILNGNFDQGPAGFTAPNWNNFTAPSTGVEVNAPSFYGVTGATSPQVMEIDNTAAFDTIYQTVATTKGKVYTFSFDYAGRADHLGADSGFTVRINDGSAPTAGSPTDTITPTSSTFASKSYTFVATSDTTTFSFAELVGQSNAYGGVIDNVALHLIDTPQNNAQAADPNSPNLLLNGSFENGAIGTTAPNWTGSNGVVEVTSPTFVGATGASGTQVLEIDSTSAIDGISQSVNTVSGFDYNLTFSYAKVASTADATNKFDVVWNGKVIDTITPSSTAFTTATYSIKGDGALDTLTFVENGGNDSIGGLIDNVSLVSTTNPIYMNAGADIIYGAAGNQFVQGNADLNTMVYATNQSAAAISTVNGTTTVTTSAFGTDTLRSIERLQFNDGVVAFDVLGNMGDAYRLYEAAFNRAPEQGGLSYWTHLLDKNVSLVSVAQGFVNSAEFKATYGGLSNAQIVDKFYQNILGRSGEADGVKFWVGRLDANAPLRDVLIGFANGPENHNNIDPTITGGIKLDTSTFLA